MCVCAVVDVFCNFHLAAVAQVFCLFFEKGKIKSIKNKNDVKIQLVLNNFYTNSVELAASPPACERVTVLALLIRQPQRAWQPQRRENPWNFGLSWTLLQTLSANIQSAFVQSYCFHSCCREITLQTYKYYLLKWLLLFSFFNQYHKTYLQYSCISIFL